MATLTLFNPKGGSGKSTTALIIGTELHSAGAKVAMCDGDPNANLYRWAQQRGLPVLDTSTVQVESVEEAAIALKVLEGAPFVAIRNTDAQQLPFWLTALDAMFDGVIVDPEGTANSWVTTAVNLSDLVIVPTRPSPMDAEQMVRAVQLIQAQETVLRRKISFVVMFACMSPLMTRDEKEIRDFVVRRSYPMLKTALIERAAYRAIVKNRKLLSELDEKDYSSLKTARRNANELLKEILELIDSQQKAAA
jgi:chromosome partitioning protein